METGTGAVEKTSRKSRPSIWAISSMPCSREMKVVAFTPGIPAREDW